MHLLWVSHDWERWFGSSHLCSTSTLQNSMVNHSPRYTKVTVDIKFERFSSSLRAVARGKKNTKQRHTDSDLRTMNNTQDYVNAKFSEWEMKQKTWSLGPSTSLGCSGDTDNSEYFSNQLCQGGGMHNLPSDKESFLSLGQDRSKTQLKNNSKYSAYHLKWVWDGEGRNELPLVR